MSTFLPALQKSGHLDAIGMTIFNVGSRKVSQTDDYGSAGWEIFAPNLAIYGFDADLDACEIANQEMARRNINWTEQHIPLVLSNSVGEKTLYVTNDPMCSSLYPPNEVFLARLSQMVEYSSLSFTVDVETTTLDTFCQEANITSVDFLQVDVQGAELQVLEGATMLLETSVLAVQVEVEYAPLYLNQPLFADVDRFLRAQGFTLFDLTASHRVRARSAVMNTEHPGQILWGNGFYFRDLLQDASPDRLPPPDRLFKLACIADVMNFSDYALELLEYLTLNYGNDARYNFADPILDVLSQFPELVQQGLESLPIVASLRSRLSQG